MAFQPDLTRLQDTAQQLIGELHLPGLALGAVIGGEPAWQDAWGWADIAAKTPLRPENRQRIASISKTMVGLSIMALVEEGRLSLDDRIRELLPELTFHGPAEDLRVRHLLTHTGGIGEAPNLQDLGKAFDKLFGESDPDAPMAELYPDGITIEVQPGSKWAYANHGYTLLSEIVARVEAEPLPAVLERRIFGPLGMRDTDLLDGNHPDLARGYTQAPTPEAMGLIKLLGIQLESETPVDGHNMLGAFVPIWGNGGAGGVQSTVPDMLGYAAALLRGSGGVVRPETLTLMTSPQYQPDPRLDAWGLAFEVDAPFGRGSFGHGGSYFGGWNSHLNVFPELDAAFVLHLNMWREDFESAVVPPLVQAFLGAPDPAPAEAAIDPRILDTAPGVYELATNDPLTDFRNRFMPGRVCISAEDGALTLRSQRGPWKDGALLRPADANQPDVLLVGSGPATQRLVVLFEGDRVSGLRCQHLFDLRRNPEAQPWT